MSIDEVLNNNPDIRPLIEKIFKDPRFLQLKDAFVSHVNQGDKANPTSVEVSHGMYLGTRFVFNEIERISRQPKEDKNTKKKDQTSGKVDPDLES